jgi:hypothetical protein
MGKFISSEEISPTLSLSKQTDGLWLWDDTRKMNLSMRAVDERAAFVETIHYYQERLSQVESEYAVLQKKVDDFLAQFPQDD